MRASTRRISATSVLWLVAVFSTSACASSLSERRYSEFDARLDVLQARVDERQREAALLHDGAERDDELSRLAALSRLLILARAEGALAYLDQDAAALARAEQQVRAAVIALSAAGEAGS